MRIWNGLHVNSWVIYNNKKYIIKARYEKGNKRLVDLYGDENKSLLGIDILECKKIED